MRTIEVAGNTAGDDLIWAGNITGSGLIKTGPGSMQLTGPNSSLDSLDVGLGDVTIDSGGKLVVDNTTTVGFGGGLVINGGHFSTGTINDGEKLQFTHGTFELTGSDLTIGAGGLFGDQVTLPATKQVIVASTVTIATDGQLDLQETTFAAGSLINDGRLSGSGQIDAPLSNNVDAVVRVFNTDHLTIGGCR